MEPTCPLMLGAQFGLMFPDAVSLRHGKMLMAMFPSSGWNMLEPIPLTLWNDYGHYFLKKPSPTYISWLYQTIPEKVGFPVCGVLMERITSRQTSRVMGFVSPATVATHEWTQVASR